MHSLKFVSLTAAMLASAAACAQHYPAEATAMADMFSRSGWKTRIIAQPHVYALTVSRDKKQTYLFTFEKGDDTYQRYVCGETNLLNKYNSSNNPSDLFFGPWPVSETIALAKATGYYTPGFQILAKNNAKFEVPEVAKFPIPEKPRKLTKQEAKLVLQGLKKSDEVYKSFTDENNKSIHGLPDDTTVREAWAYKNWYAMDLRSKKYEGVGYYQFLFRTNGNHIHLLWNWPEDGQFLVFKPEFDLANTLVEKSRMNIYWDVDTTKFGQAGLWMRERLKRPPHASAWTPDEMDTVIKQLDRLSNDKKMLIYAKSGRAGVAQFYDDNNVLRVVEFKGGVITKDCNLEQAEDRALHLTDDDLWYCYEGVARQGGHPFIIESLYRNAHGR